MFLTNIRPLHYPEDHGGMKPKELSLLVGPKFKIPSFSALETGLILYVSVRSMHIRPFHYPKDHCGVKPEELSPFVDPKPKISEKSDQN